MSYFPFHPRKQKSKQQKIYSDRAEILKIEDCIGTLLVHSQFSHTSAIMSFGPTPKSNSRGGTPKHFGKKTNLLPNEGPQMNIIFQKQNTILFNFTLLAIYIVKLGI